jgi:hypothetical protein
MTLVWCLRNTYTFGDKHATMLLIPSSEPFPCHLIEVGIVRQIDQVAAGRGGRKMSEL